jgi:Mn2+/Fe2+ NRAMP family transporter
VSTSGGPGAGGASNTSAPDGPGRPLDYVRRIGPGLVAGASDTDPTTVAAIAVVGATTIFGLAWLVLLVAPMLIVVQIISSRLGALGQADLQSAARARFGPALRLVLLASILVVTGLTLAADLEAGAAAVALLTGLPEAWLVVPLALIIVALLALGSYAGIQRVLKYLALALLAYAGSAFLAHVDWGQVLHHSFIPSFSFTHDYIAGGLAIVGTTLTSYVYVWQSVQLAEERPPSAWLRATEADATIGIVFAVVIVWFILVATGATLGVHHRQVHTAPDAARALAPFAGSAASTVFGIGLLASALVAVPVLMSTAAYVTGAEFRWRRGLSEPLRRAPAFYAALGATTLLAVLVTLWSRSPIQLLFDASIAGGIGTPIGLAFLLVVAGDRGVMRGRPIGRGLRVAGWLITGLIAVMGGLYLVDELVGLH